MIDRIIDHKNNSYVNYCSYLIAETFSSNSFEILINKTIQLMARNSTSSLKDLLLKSFNTICKTKLQNTKLCRSERAMTSKVFTITD